MELELELAEDLEAEHKPIVEAEAHKSSVEVEVLVLR